MKRFEVGEKLLVTDVFNPNDESLPLIVTFRGYIIDDDIRGNELCIVVMNGYQFVVSPTRLVRPRLQDVRS